MPKTVHHTKCVDLQDCRAHGVTVCETRAIADWHLRMAKTAPGRDRRDRHALISDHFAGLAKRLADQATA